MSDDTLTPIESERFAAAMAAAGDPAALMDAATLKFQTLRSLLSAGDCEGLAEAARLVGDDCLRLCVVPANCERSAGEKVGFLRIMSRWAWSRRPALAAIMDAAIEAECRAWPACAAEMAAVDRKS